MSRCMACASPGPAGMPCETCLVPRPSLAPLPAVTRPCPRCAVHLHAIDVGEGAMVFGCLSCRWTFWSPRAWSIAFDAPAIAGHVEAQVPLPSIRIEGLLPLMSCPACGQEMDRARFAATSDVVIDTCRWMHGVWLDAGDVRRAIDYAEHKRRVGATEAVREAEDAWSRRESERAAERQLAALELRRAAVAAAPPIARGPNVATLLIVLFFGLLALLVGLKFLGPSWKARNGAPAHETAAEPANEAPSKADSEEPAEPRTFH